MGKGRHRRHRTARELKRAQGSDPVPAQPAPCIECNQEPHASWCRAESTWWETDDDPDR